MRFTLSSRAHGSRCLPSYMQGGFRDNDSDHYELLLSTTLPPAARSTLPGYAKAIGTALCSFGKDNYRSFPPIALGLSLSRQQPAGSVQRGAGSSAFLSCRFRRVNSLNRFYRASIPNQLPDALDLHLHRDRLWSWRHLVRHDEVVGPSLAQLVVERVLGSPV